MIAGDRQVMDLDETMQALVSSTGDVYYEVRADDGQELDDHAVVVQGTIRYRTGSRGFAQNERAWLLTFVDGLVFRSVVFDGVDEACEAYGRLGVSMGLSPPERG